MQVRFGALPEALDARIAAADEAALDALIDRVLLVEFRRGAIARNASEAPRIESCERVGNRGSGSWRMTSDVASASPDEAFVTLTAEVAACHCRARMEGRTRVLVPANGPPLDASILFVAEAPGRFGGDRTSVPLTQDQSGRNFNALLAAASIPRERVFVTNAALCNPRDERGRNAPPLRAELENCRPFLERTVAVVTAPIVVTLGRVALASLDSLEPHGLSLRADAGRVVAWGGRLLVPLYHPGPRAQLHRSIEQQMQDFQALARALAALPDPVARMGIVVNSG